MKDQILHFISIIINISTTYWYLWLILISYLIIKKYLKTNSFKGWLGEQEIRLIYWIFLDKKIYHKFYNVTFTTFGGDTTQIDYIIVSVYGIFVIEIKTMNGWIYGEEKEPYWTETFFHKKYKFQNPILQNYKHTKTISELIKIPEEKLISIIAFNGKCKFKKKMPHYVLFKHYASYIKNKTKRILTENEVTNTIEGIKAYREQNTPKTRRKHIEYVKNIKENYPQT
jgi:hypothetical protein